MPFHHWGDKDFDWKQFHTAMGELCNRFENATGNYPMVKEKYGTMRIECTWSWLKTNEDVETLFDITREVIQKYPDVREEIIDEYDFMFDGCPDDLKPKETE